ncbi:cytochrome C [Sulfurimonas sp. HSL3-7]|uniref:cytochrome C n=1 Tax=Sulfonitrofixus jiaomeiensis TaxID=3131938 RepID=UPI0031F7F014
MKSFTKVAMTALIGLGVLSTNVYADAAKGQKIYQKKLKEVCGKTGAVFAASHTQMEWETAKDEGKLVEMMEAECPAGKDFFESKKFETKYKSHLYDFVHDFASDSGNIPSC